MKKGFSLVELSIVLVVIGLLAGGILTGQNLIRSSELRSVLTELGEYKTAIVVFKQRYDELPGDMPDAQTIWGAPASCPGTAGTGTQTCNGNGDGDIRRVGGAGLFNETFAFWQHLANAELITGEYSGMAGPLRGDHAVGGVNVPYSGLGNGAVWHAETISMGSIFAFTTPDEENYLRIGGETANWNSAAVFTTKEAWNIDKKIDDGHATQGFVWAIRWNSCTPATSGTDFQDYDFSRTDLACALQFHDSF